MLLLLVITYSFCVGGQHDFSSSNFNSIPSEIPDDAVSIDLSSNDFTSVDDDDLTRFTSLQSFDLDRNQISDITSNAFMGLSNMIELILSRNKLAALPPISALASSLTILDLSFNQITDLTANTFAGFSALTTLVLKSNQQIWSMLST